MIVSVGGISTSIPLEYADIIQKLKKLGLVPTGNPVIDRARLIQEINRRVEKVEEKKKEEEKRIEKIDERNELEEQRLGAQILGEQNKMFFKL